MSLRVVARRFGITYQSCWNNYAAVVLSPPLVTAAGEAAPSVHLDIRPSGTLDVVELLERAVFPVGSHIERYGVTLSIPSVVGRNGVIDVLWPDVRRGDVRS